MSRLIRIDSATFTDIVVAERKLTDAWLECVQNMGQDDGGAVGGVAVLESAAKVTDIMASLSQLIKAAYFADLEEQGKPPAPGGLQ